jgi:hypothetical protein
MFQTLTKRVSLLSLALSLAAAPGSWPQAPDSAAAHALEDDRLFAEAARVAWRYVDQQYQPASGFVNSVLWYPYATMWDVASGLAALYCGHELSFLPTEEYDRRMRRALQTLQTTRLYDGLAFNKSYSTRTGQMAGRDERDVEGQTRGYGYSALDIGRLLVWLKIIATNQPQYAAAVDSVVTRLDLSKMVADGYLWGETITRAGAHRRYMEGRIPYEQYAASGFAVWGRRPELAMTMKTNSIPIEIWSIPLVADRRGMDHLTSEPVTLLGLELGWTSESGGLAYNLLRVQEERWRRTREVTMVSEDALPHGPFYFYYYTVNHHGRQFVVTSQAGSVADVPRWVSSKAAFAWHALSPSDYTRLAANSVARAANPQRGWGSGVYESSGSSTGNENVNTAAVILEAALFHARKKPFMPWGE